MSKFVIVRTSPATGRTLYLTESRGAGVSFAAPGSSRIGVGIDNLKTWQTEAGAQRWLDARPTFRSGYEKAGLMIAIEVIV